MIFHLLFFHHVFDSLYRYCYLFLRIQSEIKRLTIWNSVILFTIHIHPDISQTNTMINIEIDILLDIQGIL